MDGAVYWVGQDGNIWLKDSQGTRNAGPAGSAVTRPDATGFYDPWADQLETPMRFNATQIADPMARQAAPTVDTGASQRADQNLAYDNEIGRLNGILGTYGTAKTNSLASVDDWYNGQYNDQTDAKARSTRDFTQKRESTQEGRQKAYGEVDNGARTLNNSVRRILGLAGAGNSSASRFAAPNAIARDASGKRASVTDTFGRNLQGIDQAEGDTNLSFEDVFADLLAAKKQKQGDVERSILEQEQGTYRSLADTYGQKAANNGGGFAAQQAARQPYQAEADSRTSRIADLFNTYRTPVAVREAKISNPELAGYKVDKSTIGQNSSGVNGGEYSPYSRFLKKRQEG